MFRSRSGNIEAGYFFDAMSVIYMINEMNMKSLIQPGLFIKMVVAEWDKQNNNFNRFLSSVTGEQLSKEVAPGKNTGIYLVGHLIAIRCHVTTIGLWAEIVPSPGEHIYKES